MLVSRIIAGEGASGDLSSDVASSYEADVLRTTLRGLRATIIVIAVLGRRLEPSPSHVSTCKSKLEDDQKDSRVTSSQHSEQF